MSRAVAIDLGASSARFALGELEDGRIRYDVIEQTPHKPLNWNGHDVWDIDYLLRFCEKALAYAGANGAESIGIDTWGVDHGFLEADGRLVQPPICYRDHSHERIFQRMAAERSWLYAQTGIQHQPFNTLYQLIARKEEQPELFAHRRQWLLLPDLLLFLLGGERGYERSIATTTQLTDAAGEWNPTVLDRYGLPQPNLPICGQGVAGERDGVKLMRVGGHDTACAVLGLGTLGGAVFGNLGTWALIGAIRPYDASPEREKQNLTNERTPDNQVRLLTNIPGFWVINRLHEEWAIEGSVGDWIDRADLSVSERFDVFDPALYAPDSMAEAAQSLVGKTELSKDQWAGVAILSLVDAIDDRTRALGGDLLRLTGGGSQSARLCQLLATKTGLEVRVGPGEATLMGNLALQLAQGDVVLATKLVDQSLDLTVYRP